MQILWFSGFGGVEEYCHLSSVTKTSASRLKELLLVTQRFPALYNHKPVNNTVEVPLKCSMKASRYCFLYRKISHQLFCTDGVVSFLLHDLRLNKF